MTLKKLQWLRDVPKLLLIRRTADRRKRLMLPRLWTEELEDRTTPAAWLVQNANATGVGSLSAAVDGANSDVTPAIISFEPSVFAIPTTITLSSPLTLSNTAQPITIDGAGVAPVSISGGGLVQNLIVNSAVHANLLNLTFTQGKAGSGNGGAIHSVGALSIKNCTISQSSGSLGGGIYVGGGSLILESSSVINNTSTTSGGGLRVQNANASILGCLFAQNSSLSGGGVFVSLGSTTIMNSTITRNSANGNVVSGNGGGIWSDHNTLALVNCTVTCNSAPNSLGGGFSYSDDAKLVNNIIWNNSGFIAADIAGPLNGGFVVDPNLWTEYPGISVKTDSLDEGDERGTDPRPCRPPWGEKEAGEKSSPACRGRPADARSPANRELAASVATVTSRCHFRPLVFAR